MMGLLSRLFGRKDRSSSPTGDVPGIGVLVKHGTDYVKAKLLCPKCSRVVARRIPERGLGRCECGHEFAILDYRCVPLPENGKGGKAD